MRKYGMGVLLVAALLFAACAPAAGTQQSEEAPAPVAETTAAPVDVPSEEAAPAVEASESAPEAEVSATAAPESGEAESRFAPLYAQMLESGVLPDMMALPVNMVADFYGIDPADCTDGLYYISFDNLLADEIVLVDAADADAADRIEKALTARLAMKAQEADDYAPEQYAIIKKCKITRNGLTVAMLVSPEAKALTELFMQFS